MGIYKPENLNTNLGANVFGTGQYKFFSASCTWTVPAGVSNLRVHCFGGGGGGGYDSGNGIGGGSGAYSSGVVAVSPGAAVPVQVGYAGSSERNGGTSSCQGVSAGGGGGGSYSSHGPGGRASGGLKNFHGAARVGSAGGISVVTEFGNTAAGGNSGDAGQPGYVIIEY